MSNHGVPDSSEIESILDLPQLYQKPSFSALKHTLDFLQVGPRSWDLKSDHGKSAIDTESSTRYLTAIISNPLIWLDDEQREIIWDLAVKRVAERSGSKAMPAMTRLWSIPEPGTDNTIDISLHEPGLTEDNLGLKTWGSSYVLSSDLAMLDPLLDHTLAKEDLNVLELGAGTGLVGLAMAATWGCEVLLTDLAEIVPNLARNVSLNDEMFVRDKRSPRTSVLDWMAPPEPVAIDGPFDIVVAADPLYDAQHAPLLASNVQRFLRTDNRGRVIIMHPLRDEFTRKTGIALQERLTHFGFVLIEHGIKFGVDDWESSNGQQAEVQCWWGVWKRGSAT